MIDLSRLYLRLLHAGYTPVNMSEAITYSATDLSSLLGPNATAAA